MGLKPVSDRTPPQVGGQSGEAMSIWKLQWLDVAFSVFHVGLILFVVVGWTWRPLLRLHLAVLLMTGFSWFVLGLRYGIGYCPCTEWHWRVKYRLGEYDLPHSYIEYLLGHIGVHPNPEAVDILTVAAFFGALAVSIYRNSGSLQPGAGDS
jgi:hypothetical protein